MTFQTPLHVAERNSTGTRCFNAQDNIRHFITANVTKLDDSLQESMVRYSEFNWKIHQGFDREAFLSRFPTTMAEDIRVALLEDTIREVDFFEGCSDDFVRRIAQCMKVTFYLDKHTLFKEGQRGNKLYFLHKGLVVISQGEKNDVLATMLPVSA